MPDMAANATKPVQMAATGMPRANRSEKIANGSSARFTSTNAFMTSPLAERDVRHLGRL
jgi:hypothetical protein